MIKGSKAAREITLEEKRVFVPIPMVQEPYFTLSVIVGSTPVVTTPAAFSPTANSEPILQEPNEPIVDEQQPQQEQPQEEEMPVVEPFGRPQRARKSPISDDYIVYECEEVQMEDEPTSFEEAMRSTEASKWQEAMEDELKSMSTNNVWDLEEIPKVAKTVGGKWVYKVKRDSKGNIERYKARLVAKDFTQREGIDYNETFSPVSSKDSVRIIMALVAHFDLELHQMGVKATFLNGDLEERVYMAQPKGFVVTGKERMGCRLKKSIYGLKQASRQWYLKFDKTIRKFGFKENVEDNCVYAKFKNGKYIFLVLYVDDILLASSDVTLL